MQRRHIRSLAVVTVFVVLLAIAYTSHRRPGDQRIWRALRALDSEWEPGGMLTSNSKNWEAIDRFGSQSFDTLVMALHDADDDIRLLAAMSLNRIRDKRAVIPLSRAATSDPSQPVRLEAVSALGEFGADAKMGIPALVRAMADEDDGVAYVAAQSLGNIVSDESDAIARLHSALADGQPRVRISAALALIEIGASVGAQAESDAIAVFRDGLKDDSELVRKYAAGTARHFTTHGELFAPFLADALKDESASIRWLAAEALGNIGLQAQDATDNLAVALQDTNVNVRIEAAWALSQVMPTVPDELAAKCVEVFMECLDPDVIRPPVRWHHSLMGLATIGARADAAIPVLTRLTTDDRVHADWNDSLTATIDKIRSSQ